MIRTVRAAYLRKRRANKKAEDMSPTAARFPSLCLANAIYRSSLYEIAKHAFEARIIITKNYKARYKVDNARYIISLISIKYTLVKVTKIFKIKIWGIESRN